MKLVRAASALGIIVALYLVTVPNGYAQGRSSAKDQLFEAVDRGEYDGPFARMEMDKRARLAAAAVEYFKWLDDRIPRLSPSVEEWVNGEANSGDQERLSAIRETPEYAQRESVYFVKLCRLKLGALGQAIGNGAFEELYQWMQASTCFRDGSDFWDDLQQAKLAENNWDSFFDYGMGIWGSVDRKIFVIADTLRADQ